jgi:uncharacterized protein YprB with RNaseH-like and TPR domain
MNETTNKQIEKEKYIVLDIETTGLNPWYGDRITCICAKDNEGNRFKMVDEDEETLLIKFTEWMTEKNPADFLFLTKNGKLFDIPFIISRYNFIVEGSALDKIQEKLTAYDHFDLQEITKKRISLQSMAELLNCTPKSGTGENAIKLWENKEYNKLNEYCSQDVDTTEEVYLKWKSLR